MALQEVKDVSRLCARGAQKRGIDFADDGKGLRRVYQGRHAAEYLHFEALDIDLGSDSKDLIDLYSSKLLGYAFSSAVKCFLGPLCILAMHQLSTRVPS